MNLFNTITELVAFFCILQFDASDNQQPYAE